MSQSTYNVPDSDGATFLANLNAVLDAIGTTNKGSARPASLGAGRLWLDDNTPSSTVWTLYLYDGSEDIALGQVDTEDNVFLPPIAPVVLDAANGRLGINAAPGATLDASQPGGGRVRASGGAGSGFEFNDANTRVVIPGPNILLTYTANVPRFQIDASGHFYFNQFASSGPGIGNTVVGGSIFNDGANGVALALSRGNQSPLFLNNNASGGIAATFNCAGATVGSVVVTSTGTTFNTASDHRLKENLEPLTGAVERLGRIPVYRGNFRATPGTTEDLILAHEVQAVLPRAVHGEKDATDDAGTPLYQSVDKSAAIPLLIAAVQELASRVAALEE